MQLRIPKDYFDNPITPRIFLCNTAKKIFGELHTYDEHGVFKWNSYSEITFSIDRTYTDIITGETYVNPLFDKVEGLRNIYVENIGYFTIQDPDTSYTDKDSKTVTCFSTEYNTASKYLENFYINAGTEESKEVIYLSGIYGNNYTIDTPYSLASGDFDAYESYYIRNYTDADSYTYEQEEIASATVYATYDKSTVAKTLYIKKYPNVRFYWPTKPELSLLNLIFEKIPDWTIGNVDTALWRKERKFEEDRIAVYDFLTNEITERFRCVIEWNTINSTVNFYEESEDGITENDTIQDRFKTDIFITRENLANEINIKYSTDDIKTKLKVSGADDLDIREVNLGKNYIINLDYYNNEDWMEADLKEAYDDYLDAIELYKPQYTDAMQGWVSAYNQWNDLMNAVPAEGNVLLVGDLFKKLYCIYSKYNHTSEFNEDIEQYYVMNNDGSVSVANPQPIASNFSEGVYYTAGDTETKRGELIKQLTLYHINEDISANQQDNILLRLKNSSNDVATIRIYNASTAATEQAKKDNPDYKIQTVIVRASAGISESPIIRELSDWINGDLRVDNVGSNGMSFLDGFKVNYIGIMGAYFVLVKDEREIENLKDYGVKLLQGKQDTYLTIFQTQTEALLSQDKYRCIVSDSQPVGTYDNSTRWLDSDSSPLKLYQYSTNTNTWVAITGSVTTDDQKNYENYQRYIDNFDKLKAVQEVLIEKEKEAEYFLNGYAISNRSIDMSLYEPGSGYGQSLEGDLQRVAQQHFTGYTITRVSIDSTLPLYTFTTSAYPSKTFAVYLNGKTPYVAYSTSQGVYQVIMDRISKLTDMEVFFNDDQWIRLSQLIREDEYSNSNILLTGYESEEERLDIYNDLLEDATKELKKISQPSLEFSMNMANILALQEFNAILNQFELGNFVRIELRPGLIKRARLLEVDLSFSDLSDFSCQFGNLVTRLSEIDKHADLMKQAVQAGKQVAASASDWQKAVDKSNKLEENIANGLADATLEIGRASGQSIELGQYGLRGRKLVDGTTNQYEDEQVALINNKLCFTADGWKTSKSAFGKFTIDGEEHWGVLSDAVVSGYIEGSIIKGGELEIGGNGGTFRVNSDGSVEILASNGDPAYASKTDMSVVQDARRFHTELEYSGSTVFSEPNSECTITCKIYSWDTQINPEGVTYSWIRSSRVNDATWNTAHANQNSNTITITNADIEGNAQFACEVHFDDENL